MLFGKRENVQVTECCLVNAEKSGIRFENRIVVQCNSTPGIKVMGYSPWVNFFLNLIIELRANASIYQTNPKNSGKPQKIDLAQTM